MKKQEKLQKISNYIEKECGGAVQFHLLGDLCISSEEGVLSEIVICKTSDENKFGVEKIPFIPKSEKLLDEILNRIK